MAEYLTLTLSVDSIEPVSVFNGEKVDEVFVVMGDSSYYFDRARVHMDRDGIKSEPVAPQRVAHLVVTYMDGSTSKHEAPEGTMLDSRGYLGVVGGPTINVANVRFWQLEKL